MHMVPVVSCRINDVLTQPKKNYDHAMPLIWEKANMESDQKEEDDSNTKRNNGRSAVAF